MLDNLIPLTYNDGGLTGDYTYKGWVITPGIYVNWEAYHSNTHDIDMPCPFSDSLEGIVEEIEELIEDNPELYGEYDD